MTTAYLVVPSRQLSQFIHAADRVYFSKPILVEVLETRPDGSYTVRDPVRDHTYACERKSLRSTLSLTRAQRALVGLDK